MDRVLIANLERSTIITESTIRSVLYREMWTKTGRAKNLCAMTHPTTSARLLESPMMPNICPRTSKALSMRTLRIELTYWPTISHNFFSIHPERLRIETEFLVVWMIFERWFWPYIRLIPGTKYVKTEMLLASWSSPEQTCNNKIPESRSWKGNWKLPGPQKRRSW